MSFTNTLLVSFREKSQESLYEGPSYHKKGVSDHISISCHQILISFVRKKRIDAKGYMYTPNCPVRFQLYRAVCFYLSVTGSLPEVQSIRLSTDRQTVELDTDLLTLGWKNCQIELTLPVEDARKCFGEYGKPCYIAMTYYIMAQLVKVRYEAFRMAWSGLNCLYTQLNPDGSEQDKLNVLSTLIQERKKDFPQATKYITDLPGDYWRHVKWGLLLRKENRHREHILEKLKKNNYPDLITYKYLSACFEGVLKKSNREEAEKFATQSEQRMKNKKPHPISRLCFIVTEYCYMLRNRSFHATEPYPIFELHDKSKRSEDEYLTRLLLILIRELIPIVCCQ